MLSDHEHSVGEMLIQARKAQGLSVEDVVFKTRLPHDVVVALEKEDFSTFTSPFYAKSFLTKYSDFLHVNAQPWVDALGPSECLLGGAFQPVVEVRESSPSLKAIASPVHSEDLFHDESPNGGSLGPTIKLLVVTGFFVLVVIQAYSLLAEKHLSDNEAKPETATLSKAKPEAATPTSTVHEKRVNASHKETPTPSAAAAPQPSLMESQPLSSANNNSKAEADPPPRAIPVR